MSYYQYMQSVYRSFLPQLNRSLRSSSVERLEAPRSASYYTASLQDNTSRYMRAATVGPTDYVYTSAMPFTLEAEKAVERLMNRRSSSVDREVSVIRKPFTYTEAYQTGGTGYSAFDYKVMDYASRLDREETTRRYINQRKTVTSYEPTSFRSRYDYYGAMKHEQDFMYDRSSVMSDFHHFRKSRNTLEARNQRAKSPLATRELDRYYGTERRSSFSGDVSSGGSRDFRFYNYRAVPYFGGSDNYVMSKRKLRR